MRYFFIIPFILIINKKGGRRAFTACECGNVVQNARYSVTAATRESRLDFVPNIKKQRKKRPIS